MTAQLMVYSARVLRDVFVWSRGRFLLRSVVVPVDGPVGERLATPGEVKRLGAAPVVYELQAGDATIEDAAAVSAPANGRACVEQDLVW